ncbi:unnamed protein product [Effrenium voratum]|nr:unnamed protein product [Effrenium voratum]
MAFVAALCSALSRRCEQQAQAQRQLEEQLRASEAEASALRRELAELRSGEALRAQRLAAREVAVDSWEAGRLKELPKLKAELKERLASQAEAHYQELEQQARRRLATAERAFHEQVRDLETELNEARAENAALGRKCFESYQARAQAQAASSQTQQQAQMQHQELHQLRANQTLMQQAGSGGIPLDSNIQETLDALTASKNTDAILIGLRLVSSKAELLGNHLQLAEVVARHLASPTPEVVAASAHALGRLGEAGARYSDHVAAVIRWPTPLVRLAAVEALGRFGRAAGRHAAKLIKVASDPKLQDDELKVAAVKALGQVGGDITQVPSVAALLTDKSPHVQGAACLTLTSLGPFAEEHAASIAAKLEQDETRLAAAAALARLPEGCAKPYLKQVASKALCDSAPETREAAVEVLRKAAEYVCAECIGILVELLKHEHAGVRACAALCFSHLGEKALSAAGDVAKLLDDGDEDLSWLPSHLGGARGREPAERRKPRCAAVLALGAMRSQEHAAAVQELLDDGDWEVRSCTLEALAGYSTSDADLIERIASLLDDDTYAVRAKACFLLGKVQATNQADRLSEMLGDRSQAVRGAAVAALGALGEAAATYSYEVANLLTGDPSAKVRGAAAKALAAMGESGRPYASGIALLLNDVDPDTRSEAIVALGQMGPYGLAFAEDLERVVQDYLIHPPEVKAAAKKALAQLGRLSEAVEAGFGPEGGAFRGEGDGQAPNVSWCPACRQAALELLRCKASLSREEEAAAFLKARLQEAESSASRSDEVSRDLREWVLRSLNEVR